MAHHSIICMKRECNTKHSITVNVCFTRRQVYNDFRDLVTMVVHGLEALLMSLLVGFLYFGAGENKLPVQDTVALLYMIGALTPFAVVLDVIAKCEPQLYTLFY